MTLFIRISFLVALLPVQLLAQSPCAQTLTGTVFDATTKEPMPWAALQVEELKKSFSADEHGHYLLNDICPGTYTLVCTFVGYKTTRFTITIKGSTNQNILLESASTAIQEVEISAHRDVNQALVSQPRIEIKGEELIKIRGLTLGQSLAGVTGVYSLQTGPSIFKPVIHGLHSNRILIFNNGVRQEGQQWGSEHAPEIDPFIASNLSVIKGASSIRYGSDALGGVILVDPAGLSEDPAVSGEVNVAGATNNGMFVGSGIVQGAFDGKLTGLSWRTQGTYRRAGNSATPDYYMENTGFEEANFSTVLGFHRTRFGGDIYFSQFNTKLGIFSGAHAESISDLEEAINKPQPTTPSYFSYAIDRPYQLVKHNLFKVNGHWIFKNQSRLDAVFARQQNERSEYDYVPLNGNQNPELYLRLITHTLDLIYKQKAAGRFTADLGFNGITQGNVREFEMLIPNFRNYGGGLFYIGTLAFDRLTIEGGVRYDYRWLRAYTVDDITAEVITPTWTFENVTGTIGSEYYIKPNLSWLVNLGTGWRSPGINELMSKGVHQSGFAYEIGNPNLKSERAYNAGTSLRFQGRSWHGEVGIYNNFMAGYIFLKPDQQYIHTIRGSYPTFTYTQVDATFRGIDVSATIRLVDSLSFTTKTSLLYAWNHTIHDYLQLVPANRFENALRFGFGNLSFLKQGYAGVSGIYIAEQKRVPENSDYLAPPPGYFLLNAEFGFAIRSRQQLISVSLSANNLLNAAYRDYMDRFRYFTDEPGRNFILRVRVPFSIKKNKQ